MDMKTILTISLVAVLACGCGQQKVDPGIDQLESQVTALQIQVNTLQSNLQSTVDGFEAVEKTAATDNRAEMEMTWAEFTTNESYITSEQEQINDLQDRVSHVELGVVKMKQGIDSNLMQMAESLSAITNKP